MDLAPDLLIPRVPSPQLALIEKNLNAGGAKCLANPLSRLRIL
jgi:BarA-like signal transduction histidine kinase